MTTTTGGASLLLPAASTRLPVATAGIDSRYEGGGDIATTVISPPPSSAAAAAVATATISPPSATAAAAAPLGARRRCSRSARCQLTEAPTQAISELLYGGSVPRRQAPTLPRCRRQSPQAVHQPRPQPRSHFLRCHRCKAHPRGPAASEMPLRSPATSPSMSAPSFVHDSASARENTQQKSIRVRCGIASMTKCRGDFVLDNACCRERGVTTNEYAVSARFMHCELVIPTPHV